jgi:AraC-like DNA-binding protein
VDERAAVGRSTDGIGSITGVPGVRGVTVVEAGWAGPPPACAVDGHLLRFHHTGEMPVRCGRQRLLARPGVYVVDPHEVLVPTGPNRGRMASTSLILPPAALREATGRDAPAPRGPGCGGVRRVDDARARALRIHGAHLQRALHGTGADLEVQSALWAVVAILVRSDGGPEPEPEQPDLTAVREVIDDRIADRLTLDDLARVVGLSRFQLLRSFTRQTGLTPHRYLVHRRIARARVLLARGRTPADVAAAVGFADQSHLGRHFRSICGTTPARYRAAHGWAARHPGDAPPEGG